MPDTKEEAERRFSWGEGDVVFDPEVEQPEQQEPQA